ncbi:hypothetical protein BV898_19008 [Hypsibius exemplaris]|uniref:Uncharacterized protein n=1 Tax=Hypsibius exemplaris TaxID=2072580 RepID=A0A9X6NRC4_HYPEX|nr:hypothetical protein BV898_19008 [Hypsibius exemplaris]
MFTSQTTFNLVWQTIPNPKFLGGDLPTALPDRPLEASRQLAHNPHVAVRDWPQLSVSHPGRLKSSHLSCEILPHGLPRIHWTPGALGIEFVGYDISEIIIVFSYPFILYKMRQLRRNKIRQGAASGSVQTGEPRLSSTNGSSGVVSVTLS